MLRPVTLPLWLFVLIVLFAAVTFASHFLFPSVRWFFRRRMERAVARLNLRLKRPIAPFKLARRHDMIERLVYDPAVAEAAAAQARRTGEPGSVAFQQARRYAREIVPAFSASVYFGFGARVSRWLSHSLYNVRIGTGPRDPLDDIPPEAAVVYVMNHRSNMDYVLVTHLVSGQATLSYAVGEWAHVWPLSVLIRAMGAYFIQRGARGPLYRRVLERYVQMATAEGDAQAVFPEGGLSLDGRIAQPKLGILGYICEGWVPGGRDVAFVPVALNYDRVIEDRFLVAAGLRRERRFRPPWRYILGAAVRHLGQRLTGRFRRLGTATVSFGAPVMLSGQMAGGGITPEALARRLMAGIAAAVPVLPVPLVCHLLRTRGPMTREDLVAQVAECFAALGARGISVPRRSAEVAVADALGLLGRRGLIREAEGRITPDPEESALLAYYAASVAHHLTGAEDAQGDADGGGGAAGGAR
ncbi:MAG: 1-acyl-sn-glycerol-3-phosphate acyltransferase [Rubellimicrobium sp.]|nr:1-acyl-sn-glycerol-3-phosphate acyltransferase [Rubellimicrobium sp.]